MPKYSFKCANCEEQKSIYCPSSREEMQCGNCGATMKRLLPKLNGNATVNECVDKYTGVKWQQDQKDHIRERSEKYYWSVEVPRFVQSGEYSMETMLQNGWVYFDDHKQMKIHTKPPSER